MIRDFTPLAFLSVMLLLFGLVIIVPAEEWTGAFIYLLVIAIGAVALYRRGIKPVEPAFPAALFVLALAAKLLGSLARYWTAFDLYGGAADAPLYHNEGQFVAEYFRHLDFSLFEWYRARGEGTTNLVYVTGAIYSFLPANMSGAFLFFAALAFSGSVLFYRAVKVATPERSIAGYTFFIFFLPSLLFWPSSLGKDAWIFFGAGIVTWGWVAFVRSEKLVALLPVVLGLVMMNFIRPHIAAFLALAMGGAYLLYTTRNARSGLVWVLGAGVMATLVVILVQGGAEYLKIEELSLEGVEEFYVDLQARTAIGGSSYQAVSVFSPQGALVGLITALARPFPWEAHNAQALVMSLETLGWLGFCWLQRKVFFAKMRQLRSDPIVAFALFFTIATLLALTAIGNFGIIARQRVITLPFLWMLFT